MSITLIDGRAGRVVVVASSIKDMTRAPRGATRGYIRAAKFKVHAVAGRAQPPKQEEEAGREGRADRGPSRAEPGRAERLFWESGREGERK